MRKKNYIEVISQKDIKAFRLLRCCHHASAKQLNSCISKNRIESYYKQGIVEKVHHIHKKQTTEVYQLSKKGREWLKRHVPEFKCHNFYTSASIKHDLVLADLYLSRYDDIETWFTERDLAEQYDRYQYEQRCLDEADEELRNRKVTMPDCAYVSKSTGEVTCVEVYTDDYDQNMIQSKMDFAEVMGLEIEMHRC